MIKAGILVKKVDNSQLGYYVTKAINHIAENFVNTDVVVFAREHVVPPVMPLFSTMPETDIWGYDAPVIATDLETARVLIDSCGPTKKYFYVWDLEWLRLGEFSHKQLSDIYNNEEIELIARSNRHYMIIKECWKEPSFVMSDFNPSTLMEVIKNGISE